MARRVRKLNIKPHVKKIRAHHKRHKKKLLKLYHKIRQHPGSYKPGYGPRRGAKIPKTHPRKPKGLNKRGSGLWDSIKKGWNWLTGHKVVQDMKKEVVAHGKKHTEALVKEVVGRGTAYAKAQMDRGAAWAKRQGEAATEKIRNKVEGHLSDAASKVENIGNKVDDFVSSYTGADTGGMPGKVVAAKKKGSGWSGIASSWKKKQLALMKGNFVARKRGSGWRKNLGTGKNLLAIGRMASRAGRRVASRR